MPSVKLCEWSEGEGDDPLKISLGTKTEVEEIPQKGDYVVYNKPYVKITYRVDFRVIRAERCYEDDLAVRIGVTEIQRKEYE